MSGLYNQGPVQGVRDTTMRDLLAVVFKRKWLILLFFVVSSALVGFKVARTPVTWSADATLMLQRRGRTSALQTSSGALPWVEVMESEVEVARSIPVLQLAKAKLMEPTKDFPEGIDVSLGRLSTMVESGMVGESNVIYITSTAWSPKAAIRIANKTAEAYEEYHHKMFALPDASNFTASRADSTLQALKKLQAERESLLTAAGFSDVGAEELNLQRLRYTLQSEISEKTLEVVRLKSELDAISDSMDLNGDEIPFSNSMSTLHGNTLATALVNYRKQKAALEDYRSRYTDNHPKVREALKEVAKSRERLQHAIDEVTRIKERQLAVAQRELMSLRRQLADTSAKLASLPMILRRVDVLDAQIASARRQYEKLAELAVQMQVNRASFEDYGVKMLSPAVSAMKNKKGDMVRMALAPLLSLLVGIGLAFYLENLDHSMKTREDIEQHLEIPVLASFPDVDDSESDLEPKARRTPFWRGRRGGH